MTQEQQHPITPPPELLRKWCAHNSEHEDLEQFWRYIATQAAQWGADQELTECLRYASDNGLSATRMRETRRPKPPSLREQAMRVLVENGTNLDGRMELDSADIDTLFRALEALND
jgi:hypothetical protein